MINVSQFMFNLEKAKYAILESIEAKAERELLLNQIQLNLLLGNMN